MTSILYTSYLTRMYLHFYQYLKDLILEHQLARYMQRNQEVNLLMKAKKGFSKSQHTY
jgi:hypothetical protein